MLSEDNAVLRPPGLVFGNKHRKIKQQRYNLFVLELHIFDVKILQDALNIP